MTLPLSNLTKYLHHIESHAAQTHRTHNTNPRTVPARGCLLIALPFSPSSAKCRWLRRSFLASDVHSLSWWPFRRALSLLKKANNCIDIITLRKSLRKTKQLANLSAPSSKQKIRKANLRLFQPHSRDKFPFFFLYQNSSISFLFFSSVCVCVSF